MQADALNVYDRVFNGAVANAIEVGCLADARRKFVELLPDEKRAAYVVQLIRRVCRLETLADTKKMSIDERTELRDSRTRPLFENKLLPYLERLKKDDVPTAPIVAAATYMTNHWATLTRFLDDGGLPLDKQTRTGTRGTRRSAVVAASKRAPSSRRSSAPSASARTTTSSQGPTPPPSERQRS